MARITPCLENGKTCYVNFLEEGQTGFGSTEYIVMAAKDILPSEFFYFLARNSNFVSYAIAHMNGSSGRQRVSSTDIEEYEVRMPNSSQLIEFEKIAVPAMRTIRANSFENRKLTELRNALLPKLMSGEIDVSKIDLAKLNSHLVALFSWHFRRSISKSPRNHIANHHQYNEGVRRAWRGSIAAGTSWAGRR